MKNKLSDGAGLAGNDRGGRVACAIDSEPFLDFGHGLLGGELGEARGCVLAGEVASGDLLDAGGGEEGDGDGGEQRGDEEGEDEGAAGIGGFNHNRAPGQAGERATEGWPEGRGSGRDRVKGRGGGKYRNQPANAANQRESERGIGKVANGRGGSPRRPIFEAESPTGTALRA